MSDPGKYRANALECMARATRAASHEDKVMWLEMAQRWFGMIPGPQGTDADRFEAGAYHQGTGQEPSTSQH